MRRPQSKAGAAPELAALALHRSYTRVSDSLRKSIGEAGRAALLKRALAATERAHPALKDLPVLGDDGIRLDDIAASIDRFSCEDVAAAIDALIGALCDTLTRSIGADMAIQLIDDGARRTQRTRAACES
jgi:hypothetical protein